MGQLRCHRTSLVSNLRRAIIRSSGLEVITLLRYNQSASGWLSEDLMQGKYDGIVAVPFMLLLFWSFFIFFKIAIVFILFCCLQRSLTKSVGEHLAMKLVKGEP